MKRVLAGCIPQSLDGSRIVMVSSRSRPGTLVFPKGGVERNETLEAAALRETFEEAGLQGYLISDALLSSDIHWFRMVVTHEFSIWPEHLQRTRIWGTVEDFLNDGRVQKKIIPVLKALIGG